MNILAKGKSNLIPSNPSVYGLDGIGAGRISLPPAADWEKQGKTGLDAGAPREASDSILCKRGKPADKPVSPPSFPNEIRTAMNNEWR